LEDYAAAVGAAGFRGAIKIAFIIQDEVGAGLEAVLAGKAV
jgi:hypothetical protein